MDKEREMKSCLELADFDGGNYPEFSFGLPIEYWRSNDSKDPLGRTIKISKNGLLTSLSKKVKIGNKFKLKLYIGLNYDLYIIETIVQVIKREFDPEDESNYQYRLNFVKIASKDKQKLNTFLTHFSKSQMNQEYLVGVALTNISISIFTSPAYHRVS